MTMAHDAEIHTLAAPYAVHALPPQEVTLFEQHLAECSACRSEVDEIRETSARLAQAEAVSPPPALKDRVMTRIATIRPLPPIVEPAAAPARAARGRARLAGWQRWWPRLALGAVAALVAVVAVLGGQLSSTRDQLDRSRAIGEQMRALVAAPDFRVVRASKDGSTGTVVMARSMDTAVVIADGMGPAPADHTYELWTVVDGDMRPAGLLGTTHDGQLGPFTAHGLDGAAQLGITVEPAGGSEQPTSAPVMVIDLPTA